MTGTPLENRVSEMCNLIEFVRPDMSDEIRSLAHISHLPQFKEVIAPVYIRRTREQVLKELPPINEESEWCSMTYADKESFAATILAEISGYGFSSNGTAVISQPSDEGCVIAMQRAMNDAGISADDVDYINAHATSTHLGDMYEAIALNRLFNGKHALISSTKGMTGHECWMAGASEIVYSTLMMQNSFVAPNINLENRDEYSEPLNLADKTVETEVNTVLSNSFGFGGTNSALVIKKV